MHFFETAIILPNWRIIYKIGDICKIDRRFTFIHKCQFSALPLANMAVSKNGDLYTLSAQFCILFLTKETTVGMGAEKTRRPPINENDDQQPGLELVTLSPKAGRR